MNVLSLGKKIGPYISHRKYIQKKTFLVIFSLGALLLVGTFFWLFQQIQSEEVLVLNELTTEELRNLSSEYAIFGLSPEGEAGGRIVPASCPSDPHTGDPNGYGDSCTSAPNACGMTAPGTIQCPGTCDAVVPSDSLCITANISASPTSVILGDASTITWSSTNATSCTVNPTGWSGTSGSQSTGPITVSETYTLSCTGPNGTDSDFATVTVLPPTLSFTASPSLINLGDSTNLEWTVSGATSCTANGGSGGWPGAKAFSNGTHNQPVSPSVTTTYFLSCSGPGGSVSDDTTVRLPAGWITASDCTVPVGGTGCGSTVSWSSQDFFGVVDVSQNWSTFSNAASGSEVRPINPNTWTFRLRDLGGSFLRTATPSATCDTGSTWAGGMCIKDPELNIGPNYDDIIRSGDTADIEITVLANYLTYCSMNDGTANPFTHSASASPTTYNLTTRALTSAQIVTFECHHATYPSVSTSKSVRIEVIPTVQEI